MGRGRPRKNPMEGQGNGAVADSEIAERSEALEIALKKFESEWGEGVIYIHSKEDLRNRPRHSTGIMSLDYKICEYGGIPVGRTIEIYGNESSGKTTLALHLASEVFRKGGVVAYIDLENALDFDMVERMGINPDSSRFLVGKPGNAEQTLDMAAEFVRTNAIDLIVIDSIAALATEKEIVENAGSAVMGSHARLLSQFLRKVTALLSRPQCKTLLVLLNQTRLNISGYGNPNTTPGGKAPRFYASVRLETKIKELLRDSDGEPYAQVVNIKMVKNKINKPFGEVDLTLRYGEGFDKFNDLINMSVKLGLIEKAGAWYKYGEQKFQGEENLRNALLELKDMTTELQKKITEMLVVPPKDAVHS